MTEMGDILDRHLRSIFETDTQTYLGAIIPELTIYEWHVVPHRMEGLPIEIFMLEQAGKSDSGAAALSPARMRNRPADPMEVRFDMANYEGQVLEDAAVSSCTMMISRASKLISRVGERAIAGRWPACLLTSRGQQRAEAARCCHPSTGRTNAEVGRRASRWRSAPDAVLVASAC